MAINTKFCTWQVKFCTWQPKCCTWQAKFCTWQAKCCTWQAKCCTWQAKFFTWQAKCCTWQAKCCTWQAKCCTWQAKFRTWQSLLTRHICLSAGTTVVRLPSRQSLNRLVSPARPRQRTARPWLPRVGAGDPGAGGSRGTSTGKTTPSEEGCRRGSGRLNCLQRNNL